jgi:hypothetical protein
VGLSLSNLPCQATQACPPSQSPSASPSPCPKQHLTCGHGFRSLPRRVSTAKRHACTWARIAFPQNGIPRLLGAANHESRWPCCRNDRPTPGSRYRSLPPVFVLWYLFHGNEANKKPRYLYLICYVVSLNKYIASQLTAAVLSRSLDFPLLLYSVALPLLPRSSRLLLLAEDTYLSPVCI